MQTLLKSILLDLIIRLHSGSRYLFEITTVLVSFCIYKFIFSLRVRLCMEFITFYHPRSSTETFYRKHLVILRPTKITTQLLVEETEGVQSCRKQHQLYSQADPLRRSHWAPMLTPTVDGAPTRIFG